MRRPIVILTLLAFIWGASFMLIKIADRQLAPSTLILGRLGSATLLLAAIAVVRLGPRRTLEEIRVRTQGAWDQFYSWRRIWARSSVVKSVRARLAFVLVSKLYRQMYANTGIATDSARVHKSARRARWIGKACRKLFLGKPMPELRLPGNIDPASAAPQASA